LSLWGSLYLSLSLFFPESGEPQGLPGEESTGGLDEQDVYGPVAFVRHREQACEGDCCEQDEYCRLYSWCGLVHVSIVLECFLDEALQVAPDCPEAVFCLVGVGNGDECVYVAPCPAAEFAGFFYEFFVEVCHVCGV